MPPSYDNLVILSFVKSSLSLKIGSVVGIEKHCDLKIDGMLDPCGNCKNILRQAGMNVWRFRKSSVDTGLWLGSRISSRQGEILESRKICEE